MKNRNLINVNNIQTILISIPHSMHYFPYTNRQMTNINKHNKHIEHNKNEENPKRYYAPQKIVLLEYFFYKNISLYNFFIL